MEFVLILLVIIFSMTSLTDKIIKNPRKCDECGFIGKLKHEDSNIMIVETFDRKGTTFCDRELYGRTLCRVCSSKIYKEHYPENF